MGPEVVMLTFRLANPKYKMQKTIITLICSYIGVSSFFFFVCFCAFSVRSGVDHFKHGRHVEAMNEYNKALDIDTNNVEALVARGAL